MEGEPEIRAAPDVFAAFGRPKGDRGSYKQWEESDTPVTVAFEILSPNNTHSEMIEKFDFYESHGVEEYYVYDPDANRLYVYVRRGSVLQRVRPVEGFVSPRLGIRFVMTEPEMSVYGPDDRRFLTFEELEEQRVQTQQQADEARRQADEARRQADDATNRAGDAENRAANAENRAERERKRAERLAEQLRALGIEPPAENA